jgi:hypothetical protein
MLFFIHAPIHLLFVELGSPLILNVGWDKMGCEAASLIVLTAMALALVGDWERLHFFAWLLPSMVSLLLRSEVRPLGPLLFQWPSFINLPHCILLCHLLKPSHSYLPIDPIASIPPPSSSILPLSSSS